MNTFYPDVILVSCNLIGKEYHFYLLFDLGVV